MTFVVLLNEQKQFVLKLVGKIFVIAKTTKIFSLKSFVVYSIQHACNFNVQCIIMCFHFMYVLALILVCDGQLRMIHTYIVGYLKG